MAEAAHGDHHDRGHMEITDQKETFHGFLVATVWGCALVAMSVALFTLAFAMNLGWFAGLGAYLAIGVATGVLFKQGGAWWAMLIASTVLLGIGGAVVSLFSGLG
jgi:hypothetical protein